MQLTEITMQQSTIDSDQKIISQQIALHLGDNTLILAQRLSEWCGHGPVLEQDIAMTNLALDLLGQAQLYFAYSAELEGSGKSEDDLAFLRDTQEFRNVLLVEQPNQDWAFTIARQFFFDVYHFYYCSQLCRSSDQRLAAIAEKAIKEVTYHLRFSSEWVIRLGDGTPESHQKIQNAIHELWMFTGELYTPNQLDREAATAGIAADLSIVATLWHQKVAEILQEATLTIPGDTWMQSGGKEGRHTEQLGFILAEMQYLQRAYPGNNW
jgi:ring-1,2-phenylacetyl-CoA epoxidase subunit PaaC